MNKTYIKPVIKVKKIETDAAMLAASGEVEASDIKFTNTPADPATSLSKGNNLWDNDEENVD